MAKTKTGGNKDGGGQGDNSVYGGMYNFKGIMDQFYNYEPGEDDELGRAMKQSMAANMIQSTFDKDMTKEMASFNNALGQSNMQAAANLELRNNSSMMQQEFNYGMQSMGAQFEFQNKFANSQHDRDLGIIGATGEQQRMNIAATGHQNRLTRITDGEQNRLTDTNRITTEGKETRLTDTNRITNQGEQDRLNIKETGSETRSTDTNRIRTEGDEVRQTDTNRVRVEGEENRMTIGKTGEEQRATDTNRLTTEGKENRETVRTTGDETRQTDTNRLTTEGDQTRKTMQEGNRLEAKTRADQHKYARNTARAF